MKDNTENGKTELGYFEAELKYLIESGKEFAKKYPSVASNLKLNQDGSDDPHIQQLLESFAFLTGTLQKQVDQNSYILSKALLENLYPNLVYPIPSMSVVEFSVNSSHPALENGEVIPRESLLEYDSNHDVTYKFKSVYDTLLFPGNIQFFKIESALNYNFIKEKNKKIISIGLEIFTENISKENIPYIRFYINAGKIKSNKIIDLIFNDCNEVYIYSNPYKYYRISKEKISKVGFKDNESLIYIDKKNPEIFKNFQEFFLFPEKFLFFDIKDIEYNKLDKNFTVIFVCNNFSDQNFSLDKDMIKLRCTPIINLFPATSESLNTIQDRGHYTLYTNYLKEKFVFFHSIDKLNYIDEDSAGQEIFHVSSLPQHIYLDKKEYFYDFNLNDKEPNSFEINLYQNNHKIFLNDIVIYADIFVSNGSLCEKLKEGLNFKIVENYPVTDCVLLKNPTRYLEGIKDSNFYWRSISYLYSDKITFSNLNDFVNDLKSIIALNLEIIYEKDRGYSIINSIKDVKIINKSFKTFTRKSFSFVKGKEINLYINISDISNESIVIFSECLFSYLQNISLINQSISLNILDFQSKRVVYSCTPRNGKKIAI